MKSVAKIAVQGLIVFILAIGAGLVPCVEAKEPIKLGLISAWDYVGGKASKQGALMAVRELNAAGGVLGRKIEPIMYDNKCNTDEAKRATERLLYKDKVDAICGFWRSDLAIAAQPLIMEAKKIFMVAGAGSPVLTAKRIKKDYETYKYTFNTLSTSVFNMNCYWQPVEIARKNLGLSKVALLGEKAAWFDPLHKTYLTRGPIVYESRQAPNTTDYSIEYTKAKAAGADIIFVSTTGKGGTSSVKQWYDMQLPMIYTSYNVDAQDPDFYRMTEDKCEGVANSMIGGSGGLRITDKNPGWYERYKKMFGEYPAAYNDSIAYDAVFAWAKGVEIAGTLDSDAVVKAMESDQFHLVGVTGVLEYWDKIHNPVGGGWVEGEGWGWVAFQWQKGKQAIIYPEKLKTADMIIPDRLKKLMGK